MGFIGCSMAVWVQICIFAWNGATYDEVRRPIANGPQLTDDLARQAMAY
jgi:hypothetical protein